MSLMDEFKKIIHPYDDEDDDYEEDVGRDSARKFSHKILDSIRQLEQFPEMGVLKEERLLGKYGLRAHFLLLFQVKRQACRIRKRCPRFHRAYSELQECLSGFCSFCIQGHSAS